jgi:hypothetical protein
MTDVSKAMELLEVAEKWLEPFGVTDPFSKLQLEGYLSLKPDSRYGALAFLKVGGRQVLQRILATPKLHYPFGRNGAFHFPSVRQIDIYEKIDAFHEHINACIADVSEELNFRNLNFPPAGEPEAFMTLRAELTAPFVIKGSA